MIIVNASHVRYMKNNKRGSLRSITVEYFSLASEITTEGECLSVGSIQEIVERSAESKFERGNLSLTFAKKKCEKKMFECGVGTGVCK